MKILNRRNFLRGAGVCIGLPALESFGATAGNDRVKRFVTIAADYGVYPGNFFPETTGDDYYALTTLLKPLEQHRKDFTVFTNLDHPGVGGGHGCTNTFLNGMELKHAKKNPKQLQSLDQLLAGELGKTTRFPSLQLGSSGISWTNGNLNEYLVG